MPANEIEKQYNELRKKYKLPDFKEFDYEFELSDLDDTAYLVKAIVRRISEKIDFFTGILDGLLQPDTSNISSLHESRFFDDYEKKEMYDIYKKLMVMNRRTAELSLNASEKEEAIFVNEFFSEWKPIREELKTYLKKMKETWKTETDIKEDLGYMG